jgi:hypothetical protein
VVVTTRRPAQKRPRLSLSERLLVAAGYLAALTAVAYWAHEGWPPRDSSGLWFYSAAVALLFAVFLTEPFYTSPKAVLGSSGALFLFALTADSEGLEASQHAVSVGRAILLAFSALVFALAAIALASRHRAPRINALTFPLAVTLGAGSVMFGVAFVLSAYAAFAKTPDRLAVLLSAALAFSWGPLERITSALSRTRALRSRPAPRIAVTEVEDPATAIVRAPRGTLAVGDRVTEPGGAEGVVVDATATSVDQSARVIFPSAVTLRPDLRLQPGAKALEQDPVVGYVAPGSAMNAIRVAAPASVSATTVEEGRLLSAPIRNKEVLFQITGASVQEELLGDETHARFRIDAQKLGCWNPALHAFDLIPWLPDPGTVVTLKTREEANFEEEGIGFVPGSRFAIHYRPRAAVTHNTAILGILGSGKTTLAKELVCRNIAAGVKVLVLDITGQYAGFFDSLIPAAEATARLTAINNAVAPFHSNLVRDADNQFGSRGELSRQLHTDLRDFLASDDPIRIYNPAGFNATTIDGFTRGGHAESLRELSLVEKTSFIALALLHESQGLGETEEGRVCLVIEEAHSLTPEPSDGLNKDDVRAVTTSARSVLQGRKYGYGCLLITQRTANVTKTILNQCHTVFALRSYDATGMAFLANYLGDQYSRLLSAMPKYHCVAFGEGITSTAPVVIRLNDPAEFRNGYWDPRVPGLLPARRVPQPPSPAPAA